MLTLTTQPTGEILTASFQARRRRLLNQVGRGLVLIEASGPSIDPFMWDRNLAYLTGVTSRDSWLLLSVEGFTVEHAETMSGPEMGQGRVVHETLFVDPRPNDSALKGGAISLEQTRADTGVDRVYPLSTLAAALERALMDADTLWLNQPGAPSLTEPPTTAQQLVQRIRERFPWLTVKNVAPLIHQMRFVKEPYEVDCLREAFALHGALFERLMRALKPGMNEADAQRLWEAEINAQPAHVGFGNGNSRFDVTMIAASGPNAANPYYSTNTRTIADGDLVLIDSGVRVNGYCSDLTRTFPANGKFTPRQRKLYEIVLEAQRAGIETIRPGSTLLAMHQAVYAVFDHYGLARYSYGHAGHPVGLNLHDPHGRSMDDRELPFEPGVVIVVEPYLMLADEGIGIRVEDGVHVTETGYEIMPGPPREIEALEALCQSPSGGGT